MSGPAWPILARLQRQLAKQPAYEMRLVRIFGWKLYLSVISDDGIRLTNLGYFSVTAYRGVNIPLFNPEPGRHLPVEARKSMKIICQTQRVLALNQ